MPLTEYQREYMHQGDTRLTGVEVRPLEDQIVVRLDRETEKVTDLLYAPQGHTRIPIRYGTVIAAGPGDRKSSVAVEASRTGDSREVRVWSENRWPMEVKVGDRVAFERRPWAQFTLDGEPCVILHAEQHVMGIVDESRSGGLRPIMEKIVVELAPTVEKSGAIFIPQGSQERPLEGTVVACGPARRKPSGSLEHLDVKPGDRVMFGKYAGAEPWARGGKTYLVMREEEVFGVVEA